MKKLFAKATMALLALVLATSALTVRAQTVAEMTGDSAIPPWTGANPYEWAMWVVPDDAISNANTVAVYYSNDGLTNTSDIYMWILMPDGNWTEDGIIAMSSRTLGRIEFNISRIENGTAVIIGIWGEGYPTHPYFEYINRVVLYTTIASTVAIIDEIEYVESAIVEEEVIIDESDVPEETAIPIVAPAPTPTTAPVTRAPVVAPRNPQTGDDFSFFGLIASSIGLECVVIDVDIFI